MEIEHLIEQAKADWEERYQPSLFTNLRVMKYQMLKTLAICMLRAYQLGEENQRNSFVDSGTHDIIKLMDGFYHDAKKCEDCNRERANRHNYKPL